MVSDSIEISDDKPYSSRLRGTGRDKAKLPQFSVTAIFRLMFVASYVMATLRWVSPMFQIPLLTLAAAYLVLLIGGGIAAQKRHATFSSLNGSG